MPELPAVTGREAIVAFGRAGFVEVRRDSTHRILKKPGHRYHLSVPDHGHKSLKAGTLRSLIRTAGLTVEQFCELLQR